MDPKKAEGASDEAGESKPGRRNVLKKLGMLGLAAYSAPLLLNLSDAEAQSRSRSRSSDSKRKKKKKKNRKSRSRSVSRSRSRSRD